MILVRKHLKPLAEARFGAAFETRGFSSLHPLREKYNRLKPHCYLILVIFQYSFRFQLKSFRTPISLSRLWGAVQIFFNYLNGVRQNTQKPFKRQMKVNSRFANIHYEIKMCGSSSKSIIVALPRHHAGRTQQYGNFLYFYCINSPHFPPFSAR